MSDKTGPLNTSTTKQYSKRKVVSNWDRYNEVPSDEGEADSLASDFEQILLAATSVGEHFTFADERKWLKELDDETSLESSTLRNIFQLNVQALRESVAKLPFYMRTNIPKEDFSHDEISDMDYQYSCASVKLDLQSKIITPAPKFATVLTKQDGSLVMAASTEQHVPVQQRTVPSIADERLNTTSGSSIKTQPITTKSSPPNVIKHNLDDIQDWLDDILNDK